MSKCYTIGHSNLEINIFLELLIKYKINAVVDVRSMPFSKYVPHFNKDVLPKHLNDKNIKYTYLGKELGAKFDDSNFFFDDTKQISYEKIAKADFFKTGIKRIEVGIDKEFIIAIMCSEKSPLDCHRFALISRELERLSIEVSHIIFEKTNLDREIKSYIKTNKEVEKEMMELYDKKQTSLFEKVERKEELIDNLYRQCNKGIAYTSNQE